MKMTRQQAIENYKNKGFKDIPNNSSGINTDVLVQGSTVVRIGSDPGYAHFARLVETANSGLQNVVNIFKHFEPLGIVNNQNYNNEYSITEIELLTTMPKHEIISYNNWSLTAIEEIRLGRKPASDPFALANDIAILIKYALKHDLLIDFQAKNIMKRGNMFIIIDPFV